MKNINITKRKLTKVSGYKNLNKNQEWLIVIVKANGETQSRHIASTAEKIAVEVESKGYASFYDVEKGRLSRFDLSTSVVPPVAVN